LLSAAKTQETNPHLKALRVKLFQARTPGAKDGCGIIGPYCYAPNLAAAIVRFNQIKKMNTVHSLQDYFAGPTPHQAAIRNKKRKTYRNFLQFFVVTDTNQHTTDNPATHSRIPDRQIKEILWKNANSSAML
jgi:hypothetical protein